MSIFNHNVYDNIRTRVIVIHHNSLLLLPPLDADAGWQVPGGGLEPNESLSDCAVRQEEGAAGMPRWVPLDEVTALPLWPKELKTLAKSLLAGSNVYGAPLFVSQLESPLAAAPEVNF